MTAIRRLVAVRCRLVRQRRCQTKLNGNRLQAPIARPQFAARGQSRGRQQMGIDIADAAPEQRLAIDQADYFVILGNDRLREFSQVAQKGVSLPHIAERKLTQH
jgi:hypothetical protein